MQSTAPHATIEILQGFMNLLGRFAPDETWGTRLFLREPSIFSLAFGFFLAFGALFY